MNIYNLLLLYYIYLFHYPIYKVIIKRIRKEKIDMNYMILDSYFLNSSSLIQIKIISLSLLHI